VRAVFALYGKMKDSKTGKPLFNSQAWKKAKGILQEILLGFYSGHMHVQYKVAEYWISAPKQIRHGND
jgi:hypothetical protein